MNEIKVNSGKAWMLAARPKTLTGAMIPVILAGALAYENEETKGYQFVLWIICLLFACLMQIAANLINDYFDYKKGTDREDRLGPERACAMGWITPGAMMKGICVVIAIACIVGLLGVYIAHTYLPWGGWEFVLLGAICVVFAFLYTLGLSYLGWGDLLVLVFFGFVPVCGTYFLISQTIPVDAILLSLVSGIAIDALLVINNYRDRDQDRISSKKTLAVRFGEKFERYHYLAIGIIVACFIIVLKEHLQQDSLLDNILWYVTICGYLLLHINTWRKMVKIFKGKALNMILGETSRNMFVMAIFLALAIIF